MRLHGVPEFRPPSLADSCWKNAAWGWKRWACLLAEIRTCAPAAIDLIGFDGYESAYPRELSGGMRGRVGFACAVVVHPNIRV